MSAQGQVPSYLQQADQVPTTAQQYVAGMPATNAASYQTNMGQLANLYGGVQNQAIPYMNAGVGAQQTQQQFNASQQAAGAAAGAQMGGTLGNVAAQYYNQPINSTNLWSGSSVGGDFTPTAGNSFNVNYLGGASSPGGQYSTDYMSF